MNARYWIALLLGLGVLLRAALWISYEPISFPDSGTYLSAADDLLDGNLARSEGRRTPGFPFVVALLGKAPYVIVFAQLLMGLAISVLLFYIALSLTGRPAIGFVVGLSYHLNLQQLFLEWTLLSEPTSTLMVVAVVAAMTWCIQRLRAGMPSNSAIAALGVLAGLCILARPQYIFLPALLPVVIVWAARGCRIFSRQAIRLSALAVAPAAFLVLAWGAFVYAKVGHFTLSTQSGFGLVNHVTPYIDLAPDRFGTIRDILIKHRDRRLAEVGHDRNTIWYAWPEIQRVTGYSLPEASREMQRMVVQMIVDHPVRYASSVASAWVDFWTVPILWDLDRLKAEAWQSMLAAAWWVEHKLLRLANLAFVLIVATVIAFPKARRRLNWNLELSAISAIVLCSSLLQALADQGASSRYAVTIQALVVLIVAVCGFRYFRAAEAARGGGDWSRRRRTEKSSPAV